jgi:hypothetical protein
MSDNKTLIKGRTGDWEIVMGLEIHAQVASKAKLFSGAAVGFGAGPNEQVSLVDAGFPGMLPTLNKHCVEQAVKSGLGLKAQINLKSQFDRRTTSIQICRPAIRSASCITPSWARGWSRSRPRTVRSSTSASSACTWSRMRAS